MDVRATDGSAKHLSTLGTYPGKKPARPESALFSAKHLFEAVAPVPGACVKMIRARFAVFGHSPEQAAEGLPFLLEEFGRRPWLRNPTAGWDGAGKRLLVTIESDDPDPAAGAQGLYDEVWDCVIACLAFPEVALRIEIVDSMAIGGTGE